MMMKKTELINEISNLLGGFEKPKRLFYFNGEYLIAEDTKKHLVPISQDEVKELLRTQPHTNIEAILIGENQKLPDILKGRNVEIHENETIVTGRIYIQSITNKLLYPYYNLFIFDSAFRLHTTTATNWTFQILTEDEAKKHCKIAPYTCPYLLYVQGSEVCPSWNWLKDYFPKVKSILPENVDNLKKTLFSLNEEDIYKIFNDHNNN